MPDSNDLPSADLNVTPNEATGPGSTAADRFRETLQAKKQQGFEHDEMEETIWSGGYSPKAMVGTWALMVVLSVLIVVMSFLWEPLTLGMAAGGIGLLWVGGGLRYAYRRLGFHYELTNQRFIHQSGLLHRQTDRIEVIDIDDVSFSQGPVQRLFDVGKITLTGSDRTHPSLAMPGISNVHEVSGLIDDIRRKERHHRSLHIESI